MTYEKALKDWKYLWAIGCAYDMTGGYVDQDDLAKLLLSPTKATAKKCLCDQIEYWFQAGTEQAGTEIIRSSRSIMEGDPHVREIAERHGITYFG